MTSEGFFLDIAKIAITVVGFSGIVSALRHDRGASWTTVEIAGMRLMIGHGLASVCFGLLPSLGSLFALDECMLWASCSFILGLFLAYTLIRQTLLVLRNIPRGAPPRQLWIMLFDFFAVGTIVLVLQGVNVVYCHSAAIYGLGCAWLLFTACRQFSIFPFGTEAVTPSSGNKEAAE